MLDGRSEGAGAGGGGGGGNLGESNQDLGQSAPSQEGGFSKDMDDEIPF